MEQPLHGPGSPSASTAVAERPQDVECRNPACHLWAVQVAPREDHDRCLFCAWQLVPVNAQDVAVATSENEWAVVDPQEIVARGPELRMRSLATRLTVQRLGHTRPGYAEPCVCHPDTPPADPGPQDLTADGQCVYCGGAGEITVEAARAWHTPRACE